MVTYNSDIYNSNINTINISLRTHECVHVQDFLSMQ